MQNTVLWKAFPTGEYVSNSFHCHVTENITPIEKQDKEYRFWELCNGGKIQYVKYPIDYNLEAIKSLIHRAMDMGFYEGVNMSLAYCDDCGHQELEMDVCPKCGSRNLTKIDRMNGYLAYSVYMEIPDYLMLKWQRSQKGRVCNEIS